MIEYRKILIDSREEMQLITPKVIYQRVKKLNSVDLKPEIDVDKKAYNVLLISAKLLDEFEFLERTITELFDIFGPPSSLAIIRPKRVWTPPTDIYETSTEVIVKMEIAGIQPEAVIITFHDNTLTVRGIRKESDTQRKASYHQAEIHYGAFERTLRLPTKVNGDQAKGVYQQGFLEITLPKAEIEISRVIPINVEE